MAVCVGGCLWVNPDTGVLEVKRDPAGGITCSAAGLSAAGVSGSAAAAQVSADAAMAAANEADDTADAAQASANAAQASANTALDRVPNKIRWGLAGGVTDGTFGTVNFNHGLGGTPSAIVITPWNAGADQPYQMSVKSWNAVIVEVIVYDVPPGNVLTGATVNFFWFAAL